MLFWISEDLWWLSCVYHSTFTTRRSHSPSWGNRDWPGCRPTWWGEKKNSQRKKRHSLRMSVEQWPPGPGPGAVTVTDGRRGGGWGGLGGGGSEARLKFNVESLANPKQTLKYVTPYDPGRSGPWSWESQTDSAGGGDDAALRPGCHWAVRGPQAANLSVRVWMRPGTWWSCQCPAGRPPAGGRAAGGRAGRHGCALSERPRALSPGCGRCPLQDSTETRLLSLSQPLPVAVDFPNHLCDRI